MHPAHPAVRVFVQRMAAPEVCGRTARRVERPREAGVAWRAAGRLLVQ
nr:hypothetical protein [Variovorax boronicumulans]